MSKKVVWEFTEEELRVLQDAMFIYEQLLCGIDMHLDFSPESYRIADDLYLSFCSEMSR